MLKRLLPLASGLIIATSAHAMQYGLKLHYGNGHWGTSKPAGTTGAGIAMEFVPQGWKWHDFSLYIQGAYDYWTTNKTSGDSVLRVYSVDPVIRYSFLTNDTLSPFLEASVGLGYMSNNKFGNRTLGTRFTFRDMLGVGTTIGADHRLAIEARFLHDSNGGLNSHNSGVGVWPDIAISYRWG